MHCVLTNLGLREAKNAAARHAQRLLLRLRQGDPSKATTFHIFQKIQRNDLTTTASQCELREMSPSTQATRSIVFVFVFAVSSCCNAGKKSPPSGEPSAAASSSNASQQSGAVPDAVRPEFKDRPETEVNVKEILEAYKNNEVRGDGQYKDKRIQIVGKVGDVKKDITDSIYVTVGTGAAFEIPVVQCFVKNGEEKAAAALNKGDDVTVVGHVDGLMMNVLVKDCEINPQIKLCNKLRNAIGEGECKSMTPSVTAWKQDKLASAMPFCFPTRETYDAAMTKMTGIVGKAPKTKTDPVMVAVGSEKSLCILLGSIEKADEGTIKAKLQAAVDAL